MSFPALHNQRLCGDKIKVHCFSAEKRQLTAAGCLLRWFPVPLLLEFLLETRGYSFENTKYMQYCKMQATLAPWKFYCSQPELSSRYLHFFHPIQPSTVDFYVAPYRLDNRHCTRTSETTARCEYNLVISSQKQSTPGQSAGEQTRPGFSD